MQGRGRASIDADRPSGFTSSGGGISRGTNHLGFIRTTLKSLTGFATLAHELIQNADDAAGATTLVFDVSDEAVRLRNDGSFADCGDQDLTPEECPWLTNRDHGSRCDFHSFRDVASGDKSDRTETTGAFGIGFTAVYQVTDHPQLISSGRHWRLDELADHNNRIDACTGCDDCRGHVGTEFILPWAREESPLRERLKAPTVSTTAAEDLLDVLRATVPTAMIFLRRLERIDLCRDGELVVRHERIREASTTIVDISPDPNGLGDEWLMLEGSFTAGAARVRQEYPGKIEAQRTDLLTIAVPRHPERHTGRFCAFLPTEQRTGLPVHVNADFVPTPDRRRLQHDGYVGEWNGAAVEASGTTLAHHLIELRDWLGGTGLWQLIRGAKQLAESDADDAVSAAQAGLWAELEDALPTSPVLPTSSGGWCTPATGLFLATEDEYATADSTLTALGIELAAPAIRAILFDLRSVARRLDLVDLVDHLEAKPAVEVTPDLLRFVEHLLTTSGRHSGESRSRLRGLPIFPASDGRWVAASDIRSADSATRGIFTGALGVFSFVDEDRLPEGTESALLAEIATVTLAEALTVLEGLPTLATAEYDAPSLLRWFRGWNDRGNIDEPNVDRIAHLPIYPTSEQGLRRRLTELALPGGFHDPLGLASILDVEQLTGLESFLQELGARELTLESYVTQFVPAAQDLADTEPDTWRELVDVLAHHLADLDDHPRALSAIRELRIVETDRGFVRAGEAYLISSPELLLLVGSKPTAVASSGSVERFYKALGAAESPRWRDVHAHLEATVTHPVSEAGVEVVSAVVRHLAASRVEVDEPDVLTALTDLAWLPVEESDAWHTPGDVDLVFRRHLFRTTGSFLALPQTVQQNATDFLRALGCHHEPTVRQVVNHLTTCASEGATPHPEIYLFLDRNADAPEVPSLRDKPIIHVGGERFVTPDSVFLEQHPFGELRHVLGESWRRYPDLVAALSIRERPDHEAAKSVIHSLSREHGAFNTSLRDSPDSTALLAAWEIIAVVESELPDEWFADLRKRKCVPDRREILVTPTSLVFDDQPHITSSLTGISDANIIPRPAGAARAMERAGVAKLSEVLRVDLIESGERSVAGALMRMIERRRPHLIRVLEHSDASSAAAMADRLTSLDLVSCTELVLSYSIDRFRFSSGPVNADAFIVRDDATGIQLLTTSRDAFSRALVRELLLGVGLPSSVVASLVAIVKEVLSATDGDEAAGVLNDCGYPPVQVRDDDRLEAAVAEVAETDENSADQAGDGWAPERDNEGRVGGGGRGTGSASTADSSGTSHDESGSAEASGGGGSRTTGGPATGRQPSTKRGSKALRNVRLRSYVSTGSADSEAVEPDAAATELIMARDRAGVARVMAYEHDQQRRPVEMKHDNPGYDIVSVDEDGAIVRHIEVKSTGTWDSQGVKVSSTQFDFARDNHATAWLYVVHRPEDDDAFEIHAIRDPARRVTDFMFDDGWRDAADEVHRARDGGPIPEVEFVPSHTAGSVPFRGLDGRDGDELFVHPGAARGVDFVTQVLDAALLPTAPGDLVGLARPDEEPEIGQIVMVRLRDGDSDRLLLRSWFPEVDDTSGDLLRVVLGTMPASDLEPTVVEASQVKVEGIVVHPPLSAI